MTGEGWSLAAGFVLAYLLGSIPFGLLLAKVSGAGDIRQIGSGTIGATHVLRTGRTGLALATLLLAGGKEALAVLIGWYFGPAAAALDRKRVVSGNRVEVLVDFGGRR